MQYKCCSLLIEVVTEELPFSKLVFLEKIFSLNIIKNLKKNNVIKNNKLFFESYSTPRRLAVLIKNVYYETKINLKKKIIKTNLAFDENNNLTELFLKKLKKNKINLSEIVLKKINNQKIENKKVIKLDIEKRIIISNIIQLIVVRSILGIKISKYMNYQCPNGNNVRFIRPIHNILILYDSYVIPFNIFGIYSNNMTFGHRFLNNKKIFIKNANIYEKVLTKIGYVIPNYKKRKEIIYKKLIQKSKNYKLILYKKILNEITSLVEYPEVFICEFKKKFLKLPKECVLLVIQVYQKNFSLINLNKKLSSKFLIVSNVITDDPRRIIKGNEYIVKSRLSDISFFFKKDKKKSLISRIPMLSNIIYHDKLGTVFDRSVRIKSIACYIADFINIDVSIVERAAYISKIDLVTNIVEEFPELKGVIGMYYAMNDGESYEVSFSCSEHYKPNYFNDKLPSSLTSSIVAIADKLEFITGMWCVGLFPRGVKDPFALKRNVIGILLILINIKIPIRIIDIINISFNEFYKLKDIHDFTKEINSYFIRRLYTILSKYNYKKYELDSVLTHKSTTFFNIFGKLKAVKKLLKNKKFFKIFSINKRISKILEKNKYFINKKHLVKYSEIFLYKRIKKLFLLMKLRIIRFQYFNALLLIIFLDKPIKLFFDEIFISNRNSFFYENRMALIQKLYDCINYIINISFLNV